MSNDDQVPDVTPQGQNVPISGSGRPRPGPGRPAAEPAFPLPVLVVHPRRPTRRWFLAGAAAVLLGAGGGVAAEFARKRPKPPPHPAPPALVAALAAEFALLDSVVRAEHGAQGDTARLSEIKRDHQQHLQALRAALADYDPLKPAPSSKRKSSTVIRPLAVSDLRSVEAKAARDGAGRAGQLHGRNATLLASIAACEATHAELLP